MSVTYPKSSKHMMPMIKPFILSFVKYSFFILRIYINYKLVNINSININAKCSDSCQYLVSDWLPFSSLFFVDIYFNISSTIFIVSKWFLNVFSYSSKNYSWRSHYLENYFYTGSLKIGYFFLKLIIFLYASFIWQNSWETPSSLSILSGCFSFAIFL